MDFIYAEKLKQKFDVYGHFYDVLIGGQCFPCRSSLEIVSKIKFSDFQNTPDCVVVMMNPGSSVPLNKDYLPKTHKPNEIFQHDWKKELIPTRPDNAQYQIMRLMLLNDWDHVKVLNLSDLRNGNSGEFSNDFEKASKLDSSNPHCITHKKRRNELRRSLKTKSNGVVIAAWGSVEVLKESAIKVIEIEPKLVGVKLDKPWYQYASPYRKDQKLEWLKKINEEVKKT
ncbi:MAG: hypothetical protein ACQETL_19605 [Bacteroidota bacterium]